MSDSQVEVAATHSDPSRATRAGEALLSLCAGLGTAILAFNILVYRTNMSMTPVDEPACNGVWGAANCFGNPLLVLATLVPAVGIAVLVWFLVQKGRTGTAILMVVLFLVAGAVALLSAKPRCGEGLRLAPVLYGTEQSPNPEWDCVGGLR